MSIKRKVQCIFATVIFITVFFCFVFFFSFTRIKMTETFIEKNEDKLNSVQKSYQSVMENVNNISKLIMVNDVIIEYLRADDPDGAKSISDKSVQSEIYTILNSFSGGCTAFIFRNDMDYVKTAIGIMKPDLDVIFNDDWYGYVKSLNGGYAVIPNTKKAFEFNTKTDIVSFARVIYDLDTQKPIGLLVINIPVSELRQTYENFLSGESRFAYVDADGSILCSVMDEEYLKKLLSEKQEILNDGYSKNFGNNIISCRRMTDTGISVICSSYMHLMEEMSYEMMGSILAVILIVIFMLIIINRYINKYITIPITQLSDTMQKSTGVPVTLDMVYADDEIGRLQNCYNEMTLKINRLLAEVLEQEKQRRKAEMNVIQEQIKPHFLYNTLDTIGCMALQNTREEVYDAVETLGTFYRKFLSKGSESITIADEISIVKNYIKLLRLRYDDMFEDIYEIEEELNSQKILRLILQPLVENSIYHGIRPKGEQGIIKISVFSENSRIHIKVYDSGIGMSREQINKLLCGEETGSFGFKGTIDRIKGFYQNDVYVNIKSEPGEYCEIEINIPHQH